uniref:protein-disulfide reductase n=1 Tax=Zea mays TaxID=4577 RepID=A0A804UCQ3_MAIZE
MAPPPHRAFSSSAPTSLAPTTVAAARHKCPTPSPRPSPKTTVVSPSCDDQEVPLSSIEERTACICLFFSAHWCRPCRSFTPTLLQAYTALRSAGKSVEIIFVSLDRDEASFRDHFQGMSWLAVPFDAAGLLRQKLCVRFAIERIPTLIPLSVSATPSSGLGCGEDAVRLVGEYGVDAYPFSAQRRRELESMDDARRGGGRLQELLGCEERDYVISADDIKIPIADLAGKTVGLYFGAHWCPPCHVFTKQLKEVYNELKILRPGSFEVIFVSIDRSKGEFQASMSSMPWLAIPYSDAARKKLTRIFAVKGILGLLILGKALKTDVHRPELLPTYACPSPAPYSAR